MRLDPSSEEFDVLLRCVTRAPASAARLISICPQCLGNLRADMHWTSREDLRHRLMVTLLTMEENHEYLGHESVSRACPPGPENRVCARPPGHGGLHYDGLRAEWGARQALSDDDSEAQADAAEQRAQFAGPAGLPYPAPGYMRAWDEDPHLMHGDARDDLPGD